MTYQRSELDGSIDLGSPPLYSQYSESYSDSIREYPKSFLSVEVEAAHVPAFNTRTTCYSANPSEYPKPLEVAPPVSRVNSYKRWRRRNLLVGWRFGVRASLILTFVVLFVNIGVTAGITKSNGVDEDGKAVLLNGDCQRVKRWNLGGHLIINILSTLLLGASNYTMQCLSAPTRSEVDRAHSSGNWLHIGVPSMKNLRFIQKRRMALWLLLTASSWPLHLFFNSALFTTLYAHQYDIYTIEQNFLRSDALDVFSPQQIKDLNGVFTIEDIHQNVSITNNLIRLSNSDCIKEFGQPFQSTNNLLLLVLKSSIADELNSSTVTKNLHVNPPDETPGRWQCPQVADSIGWICEEINPKGSDGCRNTFCSSLIPDLLSNATNWAPFGQKVDHCLINRAEDHCMLNFSAPIMYIVIAVNVMKAIVMSIVGLLLTSTPILTLGDAIADFLTQPDVAEQPSNTRLLGMGPSVKRRVSEAVNNGRWFSTIFILIGAVIFVAAWLGYGIDQGFDKIHIWGLGLGAADPRTLIYSSLAHTGVKGIIQNAFLANLAQPVLSLVYSTYNSLLTAMLSAWEWDGFARSMKGLRVSGIPRGEQRGTHFLQLPYRFSIPLMGFSLLLHWLISQSIFVVSICSNTNSNHNLAGVPTDDPYYVTCGYAPTPMAIVIAIGIVLLILLFGLGFWPLRSNIPFMFSRSKLIARECLPEIMLDGESFKRLQWGPRNNEDTHSEWSAFSSLPVDGGQHSNGSQYGLTPNSSKSRMTNPFSRRDETMDSEHIPLRHMST